MICLQICLINSISLQLRPFQQRNLLTPMPVPSHFKVISRKQILLSITTISSLSFTDIAQQNVTNLFKNDSELIVNLIKIDFLLRKKFTDSWILKQSLGQIGWRTKKNYFKVQMKNSNVKHSHSSKLESQASTSSYKDPNDEYLLSWTVR